MAKPSGVKHDSYEILNLIGYGLAKFEKDLTQELRFATKAAFFDALVVRGVAKTHGTLKNRQDLFNPLVRKAKVGWWQNQDKYLHRKLLLDSLFGLLSVVEYAALIESYLATHFSIADEVPRRVAPILSSKFRQMQETGVEAELYFMNCCLSLDEFRGGRLDDARLFGDGYDFQITVAKSHILAEVKGVRESAGGIRLTEKEFIRAVEYQADYCLAVVSRLASTPRITLVFNPTQSIQLTKKTTAVEQVHYASASQRW